MRHLGIFLVIFILAACAGSGDPGGPAEPVDAVSRTKPHKSPHGYVIGGDPARFGGFVGDCTSDENFPNFWQCQSENAGNDYN